MQIVTNGFLAPQNIHLDTRIESIAPLDPLIIENEDFKWQPFWNPIWRLFGKKYAMQIVTIGFLAPQNIHLDTRIESITALDPLIYVKNLDSSSAHIREAAWAPCYHSHGPLFERSLPLKCTQIARCNWWQFLPQDACLCSYKLHESSVWKLWMNI